MTSNVEAAREAIEAAAAELDEPTVGSVVGRAFAKRGSAHRLDTYARLAREHLEEHGDLQTADRDRPPRRGGVA